MLIVNTKILLICLWNEYDHEPFENIGWKFLKILILVLLKNNGKT